ncbi:MAG: hypothetical protein AAF399_23905 [Bacteroidota bacterium]
MKKLLITCLLAMLTSVAFAQNSTIKAWANSFSYKTDGQRDWSKWQSVHILVVIKNNRITIYSKETQEYDVISSQEGYIDRDGDTVYKFTAVDQDGDKCNLRLIDRKSGDPQLYVDFSNFRWVYNLDFVK